MKSFYELKYKFFRATNGRSRLLPCVASMRKSWVRCNFTFRSSFAFARRKAQLQQFKQHQTACCNNQYAYQVREPSALEPAQHKKKEGEQAKRSNEVNKQNEAKDVRFFVLQIKYKFICMKANHGITRTHTHKQHTHTHQRTLFLTQGVNENGRSVPSSVEVLTPAERIQKLLTRDKFDFEVRLFTCTLFNPEII